MGSIRKLNAILRYVKESFVGKDEIVDLLGISLVARENTFLLGPPGTAKSAIIRTLSECIIDGKNFEYLLTRFTEPNEIFGPFDIRKLKDGELVTNTEGMLPEASMIFLDEIFNANSAILNSLLMALNEKIFKRGRETKKLPALMFAGASNLLPEDESLNALLDRFLIRVKCDYVDPDRLEEILVVGRQLELKMEEEKPTIQPSEIIDLQKKAKEVDLSPIRKQYVDLIHNLRSTGIRISDRRAVKVQNIIAASAILSNRTKATLSDLWVIKYIWDTEEQIEILAGIVDSIIENDESEEAHPQAFSNKKPNAEDLMNEIEGLQRKWETGNVSFEDQNIIKDKLRYIQSRCSWVKSEEHKKYLLSKTEELWQIMLKTI